MGGGGRVGTGVKVGGRPDRWMVDGGRWTTDDGSLIGSLIGSQAGHLARAHSGWRSQPLCPQEPAKLWPCDKQADAKPTMQLNRDCSFDFCYDLISTSSIRYSNFTHSFLHSVLLKHICANTGKPFVRIPSQCGSAASCNQVEPTKLPSPVPSSAPVNRPASPANLLLSSHIISRDRQIFPRLFIVASPNRLFLSFFPLLLHRISCLFFLLPTP